MPRGRDVPDIWRARARPGDRPHARAGPPDGTTPLERPPDGPPHRASARRRSAHLGEAGLKPHRVETFSSCTDPALEAKVADVVGLYLDPPDGAIVLSVDEKTQIRPSTAPSRCCPCGRDRWSATPRLRAPRDDQPVRGARGRHRRSRPSPGRHTGRRLPSPSCGGSRGLSRRRAPRRLDNVSTHKTPAVRAWLEARPRITFHFTPTSASWMNQVETWFGILTRQAIRRGTFRSVQGAHCPDRGVHRQLERGLPRPSPGSRPPTRSSPRPSASGQRSANRDTRAWPVTSARTHTRMNSPRLAEGLLAGSTRGGHQC